MGLDLTPASVGIIGAGAAGLITAHVLLQDGFDVQVITRDMSVGGVWAKTRVYPGLNINNVHGEFRFSPLPMPPPSKAESGNRLSGEDMCTYMEEFSDTFLEGRVKFGMEVMNLRRSDDGTWIVSVEHVLDGRQEVLKFSRIVLCTGGCSNPNIPKELSLAEVEKAHPNLKFRSRVLHSMQFRAQLDDILEIVKPVSSGKERDAGSVVVVGGGRSARDIATFLAKAGRKVSVVFETTDAILAAPTPLPDFIRKSRFLSILSPHIELRTRLERFLHTTWLGSKIVHFIWNKIASYSLDACFVSKDSPLRNAHSLFWGIRVNDEGTYRPDGFHGLVHSGKIELVAPNRVTGFCDDGRSLMLKNMETLPADVVILATGYSSSWTNLFDDHTATELGICRHPPSTEATDTWNYTSLAHPPPSHPDSEQWSSSIYRGLIPAKNLSRRDFAINGALFTTNNGYAFEVSAHWISSYFLKDNMRLPSSAEEALVSAERNSAWMRRRYPDTLLWVNESYSSGLACWSWPQTMDELLEDMQLRSMRSGGNWLTWPFKVIDLQEIINLGKERRLKRHGVSL